MANAAKRMKEKKRLYNFTDTVVESKEVVDEIKPKNVESGTVSSIDIIEEETYVKEELESKLKSELVEIAEKLGLSSTGTKSEIIENILNNEII